MSLKSQQDEGCRNALTANENGAVDLMVDHLSLNESHRIKSFLGRRLKFVLCANVPLCCSKTVNTSFIPKIVWRCCVKGSHLFLKSRALHTMHSSVTALDVVHQYSAIVDLVDS